MAKFVYCVVIGLIMTCYCQDEHNSLLCVKNQKQGVKIARVCQDQCFELDYKDNKYVQISNGTMFILVVQKECMDQVKEHPHVTVCICNNNQCRCIFVVNHMLLNSCSRESRLQSFCFDEKTNETDMCETTATQQLQCLNSNCENSHFVTVCKCKEHKCQCLRIKNLNRDEECANGTTIWRSTYPSTCDNSVNVSTTTENCLVNNSYYGGNTDYNIPTTNGNGDVTTSNVITTTNDNDVTTTYGTNYDITTDNGIITANTGREFTTATTNDSIRATAEKDGVSSISATDITATNTDDVSKNNDDNVTTTNGDNPTATTYNDETTTRTGITKTDYNGVSNITGNNIIATNYNDVTQVTGDKITTTNGDDPTSPSFYDDTTNGADDVATAKYDAIPTTHNDVTQSSEGKPATTPATDIPTRKRSLSSHRKVSLVALKSQNQMTIEEIKRLKEYYSTPVEAAYAPVIGGVGLIFVLCAFAVVVACDLNDYRKLILRLWIILCKKRKSKVTHLPTVSRF